MAGVFKRSFSFPNKTSNRPSKPPISHNIRSISLPCRSHPLISQLTNDVSLLKTGSSIPGCAPRTTAWLCDGLTRLKDVHNCLDDILQLPQTQECLNRQPQWVEKLLEDFLRFVDVYGIFQTSVLALKEEQLSAQIAVRKRDDSKVALYIKSRKKMAKETSNLVQTIRSVVARCSFPPLDSVSVLDAELVGAIGDVIEVTVSVSSELFNGISLSLTSKKPSWMGSMRLPPKKSKKVKMEEGIQELQQVGKESLWGLRNKGDEEVRTVWKRMQDLEGCICGIENASEKVFRSLINTRVSLLNTYTH